MQHTIQLEAVATARLLGSSWLATGPQNTNTTVSGINAGETAVNRAFMRFGDFEIPSYANIVSATLQVYVSARSSSSGYTHYIFPITDNGNLWTPQSRNGATWSTVARSTIYLSRDERWVSTSIVDIANAWKNGTADPERGICIFSEVDGSWKQFDGALRANKPKLTIVYDVPASVPVPDKSSVALGGSLTTNLIANEAGASHVVSYNTFDQDGGKWHIASFNIGSATSHTYTIPTSAGNNFPNTQTGRLEVEVTTTVDGESRGSVTHEVTLTLPSDAAPTASCAIARTWAEGVSSAAQLGAFVQRRSGATFELTGAGKYGASVAGFRLTFDGKTYTREGNGSIPHPQILGSGAMAYTYTVTDSRGLSREYTGSLNVLAWTEPKIARFAIARVRSDGTEAVDGTYALASVQANISSLKVGGAEKNGISYYIRYREAGTETWTSGDTNAVTGTSVSASALIRRQNADVSTFNDMSGYEFQLVLSDVYAASVASDEMPTKDVRLCLDQNTGSMGFGGEARLGESTPHYDFYGPVHFHSGATGQMVYTGVEKDTGLRWIDGRPIYCRTFRGAHLVNGDTNGTVLGYIDDLGEVVRFDGYVRRADSDTVMSLNYPYFNNSQQMIAVNVRNDGAVRLTKGSAWTCKTYVVSVLYTKATDAPTHYYLPFLTTDNEQGCIVTASSEYSGSYPAEYAFNGQAGDHWACTDADTQRWIQAQMPYALRNIIVTLTNPKDSGGTLQTNAVNIPTVGTFLGSNDGSSWTQIGSFSGRTTAEGEATTHALANSSGYKYLRVRFTAPGPATNTWGGFSDIRIEGEVA